MKRLALLAFTTVMVAACRDQQPFEPPSRLHPSGVSASLSGDPTANATVTDLGAVAGMSPHIALAINASGRAVGYTGSTSHLAVSFEPATVLYPGTLTDGGFEWALQALSINDAGVIAGTGVRFSTFSAVFAGPGPGGWLPQLPGGVNQFGGYINNAGEVVGHTFFDPLNRTVGHATLWVPGPDGYAAIDLGEFDGQTISPRGLSPNRSGPDRIIVGSREVFQGGLPVAVIWQNGAWSELPGPVPDRPNPGTEAFDVTDNGIAVGVAAAGAAVWANGQYRSLLSECQALTGGSGIGIARGIAITPSGRRLIVGRCEGSPAVWYDDGQGGYVAELLPLLEGDVQGAAYDVNPSGQIVGQSGNHAVRWTFTPPPLPSDNRPPVADAGADRTVECASHGGGAVMLDGTGSTDSDGTIVKYEWFEGNALIATGTNPSVLLGLGAHTLRLVVTDDDGATEDDDVVITVRDTRPPEVSLSASPTSLWPPNRQYRAIDVSAAATDICDASVTISGSVLSSEPDSDEVDDDHTGDVRVVRADGTVLVSSNSAPAVPFNPLAGDRLELRAERVGGGAGRTYTIMLTAMDISGNATTKTFAITVSRNNTP